MPECAAVLEVWTSTMDLLEPLVDFSLNALSEDGSLLQIPPWANPWLILAIMGSVIVHFAVVYTPFLAKVALVFSSFLQLF